MAKWEIKWSLMTTHETEWDEDAVNEAEAWLEDTFGPLIFNHISIDNIWKVTE